MIAKHVPMRSIKKSDFKGLVEYITSTQNKQERLGRVSVTNCHSNNASDAVFEILATQGLNNRAEGDKTYHLIVSFRAGENPATEVLSAIEARICKGLGFADHQRVSAVHYDTDNVHMHIAINMIHPKLHTIRTPYNDYHTLAVLCAKLEKDYGLEKDNHTASKSGSESRADDMERHSGIESLARWIKRECLEEMRGAQTWAEMHRVMQSNSLNLRIRANGLIIRATDGTTVKASTVARDLSKAQLEKRLGPFEPSAEQHESEQRYKKRPLKLFRVNTDALYASYTEERHAADYGRKTEIAKSRDKKQILIEAAKRSNRLRRKAIKLLGQGRLQKKLLYGQAHRALKARLAKIHANYQNERKEVFARHRLMTWADWLKKEALKGNNEALNVLRAREASKALKGNMIIGPDGNLAADPQRYERPAVPIAAHKTDIGPVGRVPPPQSQNRLRTLSQLGAVRMDVISNVPFKIDNITKKGTIIFFSPACVVRDDGDKLQLSRSTSAEGLEIALKLAVSRFGNRIAVEGTTDFKKSCVRTAAAGSINIIFADAALESLRQRLTKELNDERNRQRPRADRRSIIPTGPRSASNIDGAGRSAGVSGIDRSGRKPNIGRLGRVPPPQSQNRLRTLSALGVVRIAGRSEMLLPSHVPDRLEQQGAKPVDALRWSIPGTISSPQLAAAEKYIAERENLRKTIYDIPKHSIYSGTHKDLLYAGTRNIDGHPLALLKSGNDILVLPIDPATANRLRRKAIGSSINVTPAGLIKQKGRHQ